MSKTGKVQSLEKKLEQIKAQLSAEKSRIKAQDRKNETRRKILLGAYLLEKKSMVELQKEMDGFLTRAADRKLFDLPVTKISKQETEPV